MLFCSKFHELNISWTVVEHLSPESTFQLSLPDRLQRLLLDAVQEKLLHIYITHRLKSPLCREPVLFPVIVAYQLEYYRIIIDHIFYHKSNCIKYAIDINNIFIACTVVGCHQLTRKLYYSTFIRREWNAGNCRLAPRVACDDWMGEKDGRICHRYGRQMAGFYVICFWLFFRW